MFEEASLGDLERFRFGNAEDAEAGTGVTVVIAPDGAVCGVDVRGGGPATRETDLLRPENTVQEVHAVMLAGGSAFGLDAAGGIMASLEARGIGFELMGMHVPIVPAACLFDLPVGDGTVRPDAAMGRDAVAAAFADDAAFQEGCHGAGCGATVGKLLGPERAMKSGLGICALRFGPALVACIVAVNAVGCVNDGSGAPLAGARGADGSVLSGDEAFAAAVAAFSSGSPEVGSLVENTTIGCVVTNVALSKAQATKVAAMTHDAYARSISPVHTPNDGDAIFCMSSGDIVRPLPVDSVGLMACAAMSRAIEGAVRNARSSFGLPALCDIV